MSNNLLTKHDLDQLDVLCFTGIERCEGRQVRLTIYKLGSGLYTVPLTQFLKVYSPDSRGFSVNLAGIVLLTLPAKSSMYVYDLNMVGVTFVDSDLALLSQRNPFPKLIMNTLNTLGIHSFKVSLGEDNVKFDSKVRTKEDIYTTRSNLTKSQDYVDLFGTGQLELRVKRNYERCLAEEVNTGLLVSIPLYLKESKFDVLLGQDKQKYTKDIW